jgi:hypothetical protein
MKKVILLLLIAAVVFSCKKNEPTAPDVKKEAEVSFNVTTIFENAERGDYDVPPCNNDVEPVFAKIKVIGNGIEGPDPGPETDPDAPGYESSGYWDVPVYRTDDTLYTQTIKFPVNPDDCIDDPESDDPEDLICCTEYTVTAFYLYGLNPDYPETSDVQYIIIKAAPLSGSDFQQFVENPLDIVFNVCAFEKIELYIDVLCFIPDMYQQFGFFWFEITEITVREICFFGDICIDWFDYNMEGDKLAWWEEYGELYDPIQADMPAIYKLQLKKWLGDLNDNGLVDHEELYTEEGWWYDNTDVLGTGEPLCFRYADYDYETDVYFVTLFIWAPYGENGDFSYGPPGDPHGNFIWQFTDDALLAPDLNPETGLNDGGLDIVVDGVIEFAWGDCVQNPEYPLTNILGK